MKELSIITVPWNSEQFIAEQIRSVVLGCRGLDFEHILVDNASKDKTVEIIQNQFSHVKLIANKENMGFGYANNQGAKISTGRYFLLLNPDMQLRPDSISGLVKWLDENPRVGLVSCKLVDADGQFSVVAKPRRFPHFLEQTALIFKLPHLFPKIFTRYLYNDFDENTLQEVETVRGAFMLLRRDIYEKLGWLFDPRYFIWFEDIDLCREVKRLGYQVMYNPQVTCIDYVGRSFSKQKSSVWKQRQFTKSMMQYFRKWHPTYQWIIIATLRPLGILFTYIKDFVFSLTGKNLSDFSKLGK